MCVLIDFLRLHNYMQLGLSIENHLRYASSALPDNQKIDSVWNNYCWHQFHQQTGVLVCQNVLSKLLMILSYVM